MSNGPAQPRAESKVSWKDALWVVASAGATLLAIGLVKGNVSILKRSPRAEHVAWNQRTISAGYIGSQLLEIDKTRASLVISYDLDNNTDSDYRLADAPSIVILSRLKSDGSYSQDQSIRMSYPVFLPARQHARLAVEITQPFNWPSDADSGALDKLRNFVRQRLRNVGEFVLFDEANHLQLELPSGWEQLEETSDESN